MSYYNYALRNPSSAGLIPSVLTHSNLCMGECGDIWERLSIVVGTNKLSRLPHIDLVFRLVRWSGGQLHQRDSGSSLRQ